MKFIFSIPGVARLVNHEAGGFLVGAASYLVGLLVTGLVHLGYHLTPVAVAALTTSIGGGLQWALNTGIQYVQTGSTKEIQGTINGALAKLGIEPIPEDGWNGDKTKAAAVTIKRAIPVADQGGESVSKVSPILIPRPAH